MYNNKRRSLSKSDAAVLSRVVEGLKRQNHTNYRKKREKSNKKERKWKAAWWWRVIGCALVKKAISSNYEKKKSEEVRRKWVHGCHIGIRLQAKSYEGESKLYGFVCVILWKCGCVCVGVCMSGFAYLASLSVLTAVISRALSMISALWSAGGVGGECCKKSLGLQHMSCTPRLSSILKLNCCWALLKKTWSLKSTNTSPDALVLLI